MTVSPLGKISRIRGFFSQFFDGQIRRPVDQVVTCGNSGELSVTNWTLKIVATNCHKGRCHQKWSRKINTALWVQKHYGRKNTRQKKIFSIGDYFPDASPCTQNDGFSGRYLSTPIRATALTLLKPINAETPLH